eukprot:2638695-Pleurochrysis_carterae.AAC.1
MKEEESKTGVVRPRVSRPVTGKGESKEVQGRKEVQGGGVETEEEKGEGKRQKEAERKDENGG